MFSISTMMGGTCNAFTDSCKTPAPPGPPVILPYPNLAMLMMANKATCSKRVTIMGQAVFTKQSMIPSSTLDEAGSLGGVVSGVIKGPAMAKTASQLVKIEGAPAVYQTCVMGQNGVNANCVGLQDTPSQPVVKVAG
jgi:hypothetical protein